MAIWRWTNSASPVWGTMSTTTLFSDGTDGDTGTGEQDFQTGTGTGITCNIATATARMVAFGYLETSYDLTGLNGKIILTRADDADICSAGPGDPITPAPDACLLTVSTWDGSAWVEQVSRSLTCPTGVDGATVSQTNTLAETFSPSPRSCWVRVDVVYSIESVRGTGQTHATVEITDLRPTGTSTGVGCAEGDLGGDGPGTGTDAGFPDPSTAVTECPCPTFTPAARVTNSFAVASSRAVSFSNNPCAGTELTYLTWSTGEYLVQSGGTYYVSG